MNTTNTFWQEISNLPLTNTIIIERSKHRLHPRYPQVIYALDFGPLESATVGDGSRINVWLGTQDAKH